MLQLIRTEDRMINGVNTPSRVYRNSITGTETTTYLLRTDLFKNTWWGFEDLFTVPFIRQLAAKKVLDLYGNGLALEDVKSISAQIKAILRSPDPDKYERAYAKTLELENLAETMADPVKQCMGLCTVYLLLNDEQPDAWISQVTNAKMTALGLDIGSQTFFLNWWIGNMRDSGALLRGLSAIASTAIQREEKPTVGP